MFKYKKNGEFVKPKMDTKQKLHTTISMLALTVIALTTATYAWFTLSASTRVRELELEVTAGANLRIATRNLGNDIDDYFEEIVDRNGFENAEIDEWLQAEYKISLDDMLLSPHTSGNGVNLYTKTANENSGNPSEPNLSSGTFMEYELWFIAESDMRVHLSTDDDDDGVWTHVEPSSDNSGNQDNIVECVRMSFTCDKDNRTVIWEPNKDNNTILVGQAAREEIETTDLSPHNQMDYTNDTWICELEAYTPKMVTVRVWVEGEDPECDDDVQRAKFITELRFQGTDENNNIIS